MIGSHWMAKRTFVYPSLAIAVWLQHGLLWLWATHTQDILWLTLLNHWDAEHYTIIATLGYQGANWVFFSALSPAGSRVGSGNGIGGCASSCRYGAIIVYFSGLAGSGGLVASLTQKF